MLPPDGRSAKPAQLLAVSGRSGRVPTRMAKESRDLIEALLTREPRQRCGCMRRGAADVRDHAFFAALEWQKLRLKRVTLTLTLALSLALSPTVAFTLTLALTPSPLTGR